MATDVVYLDHAATTPMRAEAIAAMEPFHNVQYANPSGSHRFARDARKVLDECRDDVADVFGCHAGEIIFTGGGTEGDNAAIFGALRRLQSHNVTTQVVCSASEHHAVLHCVEHVGGVVVGTDAYGAINLNELTETLTRLHAQGVKPVVSVMAVNNEVGTITNMEEVSRIVRRYAPTAILHTDAVQGACWVDLAHLVSLVDILTLSSHKFGGPKGSGIMYLRNGVHLEPLIFGGGQERDVRSGTLHTPAIAAFATAAELSQQRLQANADRIKALRERLIQGVTSAVEDVRLNGGASTLPGIAHFTFAGAEGDALLLLLDAQGVQCSTGSACSAGIAQPSHVLIAMGMSAKVARSSIRFSIGTTTTEQEIDKAISVINEVVTRARAAGVR